MRSIAAQSSSKNSPGDQSEPSEFIRDRPASLRVSQPLSPVTDPIRLSRKKNPPSATFPIPLFSFSMGVKDGFTSSFFFFFFLFFKQLLDCEDLCSSKVWDSKCEIRHLIQTNKQQSKKKKSLAHKVSCDLCCLGEKNNLWQRKTVLFNLHRPAFSPFTAKRN